MLKLAGYEWQSIEVMGGGTPDQHELSIATVGEAAPELALALSGGVNNGVWNGEVGDLNVEKTPIGNWKLHEPVAVSVSATDATAEVLCVTNLPAVVCADGNWNQVNGVKARLAFERFNAKLIEQLIPPDIRVNAPVSGTADINMGPQGKPDVNARIRIPGGEIQYESEGEMIAATLGESSVDVNVNNDRLSLMTDLALGQIGTVSGDININDLYGRQTLSGTIKSEVKDISLAGIAASQLRGVDGSFNSDLTLTGSVAAPQVKGSATLSNFAAEVPSQSLKLKDGNVRLESDGRGRLNVEGSLLSGEGEIGVNGFFNPATGQMEINLVGDNFQVANAKRQKASISPDLNIKIDNNSISVQGELAIPSAFVAAGGDAGVVGESPDVIVLNETEAVPETETNINVDLGIKVILGDVKVKAGQFNGGLGGELTIEQLPGNLPTGSGVIEVVSGDFLVYGQKLTMERGRILFGGGPLDNPALDFDVFRDVPTYDVKAGARITGTAQAPVLELKSEPQQTDANTISFILLGKPVGTGVSYTIGKFITPDLYVSYGIDLFDKIETFNLRYRVTERLALIAASSTNSSADLIYTIER